jgi:hypothetical protein
MVILFAGLCSLAKGGEMDGGQLFRPFDESSRPVATPPVAPASSVAPVAPVAGDGYYSRQLLFDPVDFDGDNPNDNNQMSVGSYIPAGEIPWWFLLIGAVVVGMGVRWRRKSGE